MEGSNHREGFIDFVAGETWAGGPSPNLKLVAELSKQLHLGDDRPARTWLACCYAAIYNTSGTLALFNNWQLGDVLDSAPGEIQEWLEEHRPGIPVHSNRRRTHGSPRKMEEGLRSLAAFADAQDFETYTDYDRLWAQVHEIDHVGRYFGIKLAGTLHALGLTRAQQYDIRANGAKNGRRALALLYPAEAEKLDMKLAGNSRDAVRRAEVRAQDVKLELEQRGLSVGWFQLEALLCEFNQMVKGDRYPGKTSDADCDVLLKAELHFDDQISPGRHPGAFEAVWDAREAVLPPELYDQTKREDLLSVYRDHGYVWIDGFYDYRATEDFAAPAIRSVPTFSPGPLTARGKFI